jgi:hypothetical protein
MKRHLPALAAFAMGLIGNTCIPSLKASEVNKETSITIDHQVAVRGTILPPGTM